MRNNNNKEKTISSNLKSVKYKPNSTPSIYFYPLIPPYPNSIKSISNPKSILNYKLILNQSIITLKILYSTNNVNNLNNNTNQTKLITNRHYKLDKTKMSNYQVKVTFPITSYPLYQTIKT